MKKILLIIAISLFTLIPAFAHDSDGMSGFNFGIAANFNKKGIGYEVEQEFTVVLLNTGLQLKIQDGLKPETSMFIGMGLVNLIQIQYGTNFNQNMLRIKSMIPLNFKYVPLWTSEARNTWLGRTSVSLNYTKNYENANLNSFSIGICYLLTTL